MSALWLAQESEYGLNLIDRIVGPSKGKGHLLKKAATSNALYLPNVVENVSYIARELIGSVKLRKNFSQGEAGALLHLRRDLVKAVGVSESEDAGQWQRLEAISGGYRTQPWQGHTHREKSRRAHAQSGRTVQHKKKGEGLTVLGPATMPTIVVKHEKRSAKKEKHEATTGEGAESARAVGLADEASIDVLGEDDEESSSSYDPLPPPHAMAALNALASVVASVSSDESGADDTYKIEPQRRGVKRPAVTSPTPSPRKRARVEVLDTANALETLAMVSADVRPPVFDGLVFRLSKYLRMDVKSLADLIAQHGGAVLHYTTKHVRSYAILARLILADDTLHCNQGGGGGDGPAGAGSHEARRGYCGHNVHHGVRAHGSARGGQRALAGRPDDVSGEESGTVIPRDCNTTCK